MTATSVDALVEGVHFRIPPFTHRQAGRKALAAALSDLAAMGARSGEAYVQLGVPAAASEAELLEVADGLGELAAATDTAVAGGDITRAPCLLLAITVVGHAAAAADLVARSGARPGDVLAVTGELGGAAAGLRLLDDPALGTGLEQGTAGRLRARQLEPVPRLAAGIELAAAGATAMIDLSDGLGADAGHVADASAAGIVIEAERIPVQEGVAAVAVAGGADPLDLAVGGGEDYELLATLPPGCERAAAERLAALGVALTVIGSVREGDGVALRRDGAEAPPPAGFDQLRPR